MGTGHRTGPVPVLRWLLKLVPVNEHGGTQIVLKEMLAHPLTVFGLGDGGAHVGLISDATPL